jgi:Flp pilus assembly protein TadD
LTAHRIIWSIAFVALAVAVAALVWRSRSVDPLAAPIATMLDLLDNDPQARLAETRAAVEAVIGAAGTVDDDSRREVLYAAALRAHGQGDSAESEALLRKAIDRFPGWAVPYNGLGIILFGTGRHEEAEEAFRQAIALKSTWSRPHNDLAILLRLTGRYEEAEEQALWAIELAPDSLDVRNNYGNLLVRLGRYEEAEKQYREALAIDPNHPWPHYNLACLYSLKNKPDAALEELAFAITHHPPFREEARTDGDFDSLRTSPDFRALVYDDATPAPADAE